MTKAISSIALVGRYFSISGGVFTAISALSFFPLLFNFDSNSGINYICWLLVAISYLLMTIANKHVVKAYGSTTEVFYSEVAATFATMYACYECAVYYLQLTYLKRASDTIGISLIKDEPGTPVFALDLLGYFLLSISTVFIAFSVKDEDQNKLLKYLLLVHGCTGMTCIFVPALPIIYDDKEDDDTMWQFVLLFWCAQFVPICFLMSNYFSCFQVTQKSTL